MTLPPRFQSWFARRGWTPHPHQLTLLDRAAEGGADLLIAPTGGGKTLAGFLASLVALADDPPPGLHTIYVSPLKAPAADIRRNLEAPVAEIGLEIRVEDRTGDTRQTVKNRQRVDPPHILLTTPESLALMLSYPEAPKMFGSVARVIVDEAHALAESKRGDQLALCLARLRTLASPNPTSSGASAPDRVRPSAPFSLVGLSATIENPGEMSRWLAPDGCRVLQADPGPDPDIRILEEAGDPPWSGSGGRYAARAIMEEIRNATTTLVFINTRATAELFFQALWAVNDEALPIGLHHGSLAREVRQRTEAAMAAGALRAVVCTASLDLGIDWGSVDLVIQVGAPKNVKRLVQRIGRANHRYNAPSRAILVPANRFEVLECRAALDAVRAHTLDGDDRPPGPLDVLCQHILLTACSAPFDADALYAETLRAGPYRALTRPDFDACLDFCATGGYALKAYDRWRRLQQQPDGLWRLRDPRAAARLRMNVGTIVASETLAVRLRAGRMGPKLGEVEEAFAAHLTQGDTFLIGGEVVRYEGLREMTVEVTRNPDRDPKIAVFSGTKLATSTFLAHRVFDLLETPAKWRSLPFHTADWLRQQADYSAIPTRDALMVETFPRGDRWHMCVYSFAGKNAQQTLGLLLTKRMEEAGLEPLGFVSTDYALLVWGLREVTDPAPLFDPDGLREGLETWLGGNAVMKRTFRTAAVISGLIERNLPGAKKSGRQATFSSDILYDTLRKYDPDHLMMKITRDEAMRGLVDFDRIEEMCARAKGRLRHVRARHVTPFAAPLILEVGKVPIKGAAEERMLEEEADALMAEAGLAAT
jgi:ATP-dependent Lhr-like helicase